MTRPASPARRLRLLLATALLASTAGLAACSDTDSEAGAATPPGESSSSKATGEEPGAEDSADASPSVTDQPDLPDPDDPALDPALSEPVEDSVYPDVGDPSIDSLHYDLQLTWKPDNRTLEGITGLTFRSTEDSDHVQLDLIPQLRVESVQVDGADAEFEHLGKDLSIAGDFAEDERHLLTIAYAGTPMPVDAPTTRSDFTTLGFTIAADKSAWTMQEPFGAYSWFPANDQPSDKAFYDFTLTTPSPFVGVANGVLTSREERDGNTVTQWHLDSRTSTYLVTVAFGDYEMTEDESPSGVPISYWVPRSTPEYADNLAYTPQALDWVESKLGPYPWSSLGVVLVDSRSGMETQTMITLGTTDYATARDTIVHEIVHQWYGDKVTPNDWRDVWMNEGMTMYLQFVYQSETFEVPLRKILKAAAPYERESRRVNGPPADYDPGTFGEINIYYGPALMWDQIRRRVGEEKFWDMVRAWPSYDEDGTVNRDDYLPWVEEQTGAELDDLFEGWLFSPTSPPFP